MAVKSLMIGVVVIFVLTIHVECIRKNNARLSGGVNTQRHSRPFQVSHENVIYLFELKTLDVLSIY